MCTTVGASTAFKNKHCRGYIDYVDSRMKDVPETSLLPEFVIRQRAKQTEAIPLRRSPRRRNPEYNPAKLIQSWLSQAQETRNQSPEPRVPM